MVLLTHLGGVLLNFTPAMILIRFIVWSIVLTVIVRFIFRFLFPVVQMTRMTASKMQQMQQQMQDMQQRQQQPTPPPVAKSKPQSVDGEYIEYEEVK